jgi:hypothetical protein
VTGPVPTRVRDAADALLVPAVRTTITSRRLLLLALRGALFALGVGSVASEQDVLLGEGARALPPSNHDGIRSHRPFSVAGLCPVRLVDIVAGSPSLAVLCAFPLFGRLARRHRDVTAARVPRWRVLTGLFAWMLGLLVFTAW